MSHINFFLFWVVRVNEKCIQSPKIITINGNKNKKRAHKALKEIHFSGLAIKLTTVALEMSLF